MPKTYLSEAKTAEIIQEMRDRELIYSHGKQKGKLARKGYLRTLFQMNPTLTTSKAIQLIKEAGYETFSTSLHRQVCNAKRDARHLLAQLIRGKK